LTSVVGQDDELVRLLDGIAHGRRHGENQDGEDDERQGDPDA
jgi:hypothetical protein